MTAGAATKHRMWNKPSFWTALKGLDKNEYRGGFHSDSPQNFDR
jgi:hypothetical protein